MNLDAELRLVALLEATSLSPDDVTTALRGLLAGHRVWIHGELPTGSLAAYELAVDRASDALRVTRVAVAAT